MTETETTQSPEITGQMFLYERPELLNKEQHSGMGFSPVERPFDFVAKARAIPLATTEFASAMRNYPIIFSNMENPVPLAVVGIAEDDNQFVGEDGRWDEMTYIPMYVRCHPFAFASGQDGRMAVVVDTAAATVSKDPQFPFFVDGELSEHSDVLMKACAQFEQERQRTQAFCEKLKELDLLVAGSAKHTPEGETEGQEIATYVSVNVEKLDDLPADVVYDLHKSGYLSAMYLQLCSLENWRHLVAHKVKQQKDAA